MSGRMLWKVSVATSPEAEEAVTELLQRFFGEPAVSYTNIEARKTFVTVYLSRRPAWPGARSELKHQLRSLEEFGLETGSAAISLRKISAQDWAESWKRHFQPQVIGGRLLVKPSWSRRKPGKGQAVVVLDPGLSFGTGQHPTTAFCLEQVVQAAGPSRSFLDIGTGSGILAIAAAVLGYGSVHAFDNDLESIRVAQSNALQNGMKISFARKDVRKLRPHRPGKYSVVCANLISNLLLEERDRVVGCVAPDGLLVLSGILATEFKEVQRAYEKAGLRLCASRTEGEWRSGSFRFRLSKPSAKKADRRPGGAG